MFTKALSNSLTSSAITNRDNHHAIPKVKGKPIVGCLPNMAQDNLGFFASLARDHEDIVEFELPFGTSAALVTSPELCHQVLSRQHKKFRKSDRDISIMGTILGSGLVTVNDHTEHKIQRKMVQPGFHMRRIESYAQTMANYTQTYLENWQATGAKHSAQTRDISDDMFKLTMHIVSKTLFDIDMNKIEDDDNHIGQAIHRFQCIAQKRFDQVFQSPPWLPTRANRESKAIRQLLDDTMNEMIAQRKNASGEIEDKGDLLSMFLNTRYEDGSALSSKTIMDEMITLFVAGHETTSNAMTWTFYLLAKHPEIQARLQAELDQVLAGRVPSYELLSQLEYTEMVIKEAMRILPPAWTLNARQANEDVDINGYLIPKNKILFISPYANHHNPRLFPEPEHFDPERFRPENEKRLPRNAYMPFGGGPRLCIGNAFAMMEAKLILASFVQRFSFSPSEQTRFEPLPQITLSNKGGMPLRVTPR